MSTQQYRESWEMPPGPLENFFTLEDKNLEKKIAIAVEKIYLRSLWFTKDRRKHNSEGSRGHIYYGRFCTRELLWYHDVLLGQPKNDMQSSLLNDIELIWKGQNDYGNIPRGYGAGGEKFHYDFAYWDYDDRFPYEYAWICYPIDNVPALIITTIRYYYWTGNIAFLKKYRAQLTKAFEFMNSITKDYLYGMKWKGEESIDWREQEHTHKEDGSGNTEQGLAEDEGINGCTTYNQALFYQAVILMAEMERTLGNKRKFDYYQEYARKIFHQSNLDYHDGGLWDSDSNTYIGWKSKDGKPHYLYGTSKFEPMAQIWAIYWGLASSDQARKILSLFDKNYDNYITPHGYVMVNQNYRMWDGWYFGGYASVIFAKYGYQKRAKETLERMTSIVNQPGQPVEHESIDGIPTGTEYNVVQVINILRVIKKGVFGVEVGTDPLVLAPTIEGSGSYEFQYREKEIIVEKTGEGNYLNEVWINGKRHSTDGYRTHIYEFYISICCKTYLGGDEE